MIIFNDFGLYFLSHTNWSLKYYLEEVRLLQETVVHSDRWSQISTVGILIPGTYLPPYSMTQY
jgi:hypothetical protein